MVPVVSEALILIPHLSTAVFLYMPNHDISDFKFTYPPRLAPHWYRHC
jgi:hypothetical protein